MLPARSKHETSTEVAHLRGVRGDGVRRCLPRLLPWLLQPGQLEELARPLGLASSQLVRVRPVREAVPGGVRAGLLFIEFHWDYGGVNHGQSKFNVAIMNL